MLLERGLVKRVLASGYSIALVDLINLFRCGTKGSNLAERPLLMDLVLGMDCVLRKSKFWPVYFADKCLTDVSRSVLRIEAERFDACAKTFRLWRKFQSFAQILSCGGNSDDSEAERLERRADPFLLSELENLVEIWQDHVRLPLIISCDKYRDWSKAFPIATANRDENDVPALVVPFTVKGRTLEIPKLGIRSWCWSR